MSSGAGAGQWWEHQPNTSLSVARPVLSLTGRAHVDQWGKSGVRLGGGWNAAHEEVSPRVPSKVQVPKLPTTRSSFPCRDKCLKGLRLRLGTPTNSYPSGTSIVQVACRCTWSLPTRGAMQFDRFVIGCRGYGGSCVGCGNCNAARSSHPTAVLAAYAAAHLRDMYQKHQWNC